MRAGGGAESAERARLDERPTVVNGAQGLLILAVFAVGVLHTMVPDHWVPIALLARQRAWSRSQTAAAAFRAGIGHVLSTLAIGILAWIAGAAFATRFGGALTVVSSLALIGFGGWIAGSAYLELRAGDRHQHDHDHEVAERSQRTALLLILGSSPMVEGIPAFFAAARYGFVQIAAMAVVFSLATLATYVGLCLLSSEGLQRLRFGWLERYGEVLSGACIASIGLAFLLLPMLRTS